MVSVVVDYVYGDLLVFLALFYKRVQKGRVQHGQPFYARQKLLRHSFKLVYNLYGHVSRSFYVTIKQALFENFESRVSMIHNPI